MFNEDNQSDDGEIVEAKIIPMPFSELDAKHRVSRIALKWVKDEFYTLKRGFKEFKTDLDILESRIISRNFDLDSGLGVEMHEYEKALVTPSSLLTLIQGAIKPFTPMVLEPDLKKSVLQLLNIVESDHDLSRFMQRADFKNIYAALLLKREELYQQTING